MTISSTTTEVIYTGDGSTTAFPTTFPFFGTSTSAELTVIERTIATGAETTKTNGTDYTVSGGSGTTGTVTAAVAPANTVQWLIKRNTTKTQETDYVENDPFPAESHEDALDRLTLIAQEAAAEGEKAFKYSDTYSGGASTTVPDPSAGKALKWNDAGTALENSDTDPDTAAAAAEASATAAAASAAAAAASESSAATTYDNFDDRYLGAKASDPTLDNDGDALIDGALYFDTTLNVMKFYDLGNTAWKQTTPTSADQTNIDAAVANASNINTVAAIDTDVTTVAGISANVTTVAGNTSNINAVAADATDIGTVAGISSDVTTVAGISSDVTTVAADSTDIGTVAGISANVTTVAGISSDVTTVAGISGDVSSVAAQVIGYDFSTTTAMADPGSGNVRFNNATVASVTAIAIDDLDKNGVDQSAYIALFDDSTNTVKGTLVFRTGGGDVATFNITDLTDNTGWFQIAVTHVASSGTFADGEDTFIGFTRSGDKGADGAGSGDVSGPGSATDNAVVRWDGASGQLVQNSGVTINDSGDLTANNLSGTNTGDEVAASESTAGVVELATTAEAEAGTNNTKAMTPLRVAQATLGRLVSVQVFTTSGTWTKPSGVTSVLVKVVGGGGGGGGVGTTAGEMASGGGGAGGYSIEFIDVSGTSSETVTVGAGGAGGVGAANGSTGGTSSFGAYCSATGGSGGTTPGASAGVPGSGGAGGSGSGGDYDGTGIAGGTAEITNGTPQPRGGTGGGEGGAAPNNSNTAVGVAGAANTGGGGSGAQDQGTTARNGGAGGSGYVIVWEYA
jgi:hypothetical protein